MPPPYRTHCNPSQSHLKGPTTQTPPTQPANHFTYNLPPSNGLPLPPPRLESGALFCLQLSDFQSDHRQKFWKNLQGSTPPAIATSYGDRHPILTTTGPQGSPHTPHHHPTSHPTATACSPPKLPRPIELYSCPHPTGRTATQAKAI